jgi:transposase
MRTPGSPQELESRRRRAIDLLERGFSTTEIAVRLKVNPRSVRRWRAEYERRGESGVRARPTPGRACQLTARQRKALCRRLAKGAKANGFASNEWTCPRVAALIERCYGVSYHVDHIGRLLRSLGMSFQ